MRKPPRLLVRTVLGLFALGVVFGGYALFETQRFVVTVRNENQYAVVTDIEVVLKTEHASIGQLASGASERLTRMKTVGESALDVRFKIGGALCHHLNEYVESARGYRIEIQIRSCAEIRSRYGLWPMWIAGQPWYRSKPGPQRR